MHSASRATKLTWREGRRFFAEIDVTTDRFGKHGNGGKRNQIFVRRIQGWNAVLLFQRSLLQLPHVSLQRHLNVKPTTAAKTANGPRIRALRDIEEQFAKKPV